MNGTSESEKINQAARAGWLYYVAGNRQEEIASKLGISRQSAQRLVSLAISQGLVKVRLDHPIARCMTLARDLKAKYDLRLCDVVPSDPSAPFAMIGVAQSAANQIEIILRSSTSKTIAFGTGRSLRACVEELEPQECPQHVLVSLLGNIMMDGSATAYNVIIRLAEKVNARHFPMPIPPVARSVEERKMYVDQEPVVNIKRIAARADATFVGVGEMNENCPMHVDGFITHDEMQALQSAGAVGEITSWAFDEHGNLIEGLVNDRVTNVPLKIDSPSLVCGIAAGEGKVSAIKAAMKGKLLNGLITNEATAELLL